LNLFFGNAKQTGSLMANSCRAAVMLADLGTQAQDRAFDYGRHVGLAFQVRHLLVHVVGSWIVFCGPEVERSVNLLCHVGIEPGWGWNMHSVDEALFLNGAVIHLCSPSL
jgi:hypothetical protein